MSAGQLTSEALALPLADRVELAQALWESIEAGLPESDEQKARQEAARRADELASGAVEGIPHEEVMAAARESIQSL